MSSDLACRFIQRCRQRSYRPHAERLTRAGREKDKTFSRRATRAASCAAVVCGLLVHVSLRQFRL